MLKKVIGYLDLQHVGFLEMFFALTPILCGFHLGAMPLSLLMWVVLIGIVILQGKINQIRFYKPLLYFTIYWLAHTLVIMAIDNVNFNGFVSQIIYFIAVFSIYPVLDLEKLKGSLNWVAIISIAGLLYQWQEILRGGMVRPLGIPGLEMSATRLMYESLRPSSFFMEPASYVAFMIYPLFFALSEKKYIWVVVLILSVFLTTSTTGLVLSFIMLAVSMLGVRKAKSWTWIVTLVIGGGLYLALTNFSAFEMGVEKIENTDASTNVRLSQGIYVVSTMQPEEYVFGVPYSSSYNYCISGRVTNAVFYGESVFLSTFWEILLLYGIVGLALYLNVYLQILKQNRITLPLVVSLIAVLFSSGYALGVLYIFSMIMLLVIAKSYTIQMHNVNTN